MRMARPGKSVVKQWLMSVVALLWCLGAAPYCAAQTPLSAEAIQKLRATKAPEDWTLEERLAVRFDPGDVRRRREADRAAMVKSGDLTAEQAAVEAADDECTNSVAGSRNPELFLPSEIFEKLIFVGFNPDPEFQRATRQLLEPRLRTAGLDPETFWTTLESIARKVIQANNEFLDLDKQFQTTRGAEHRRIKQRAEAVAIAKCGPRAEALARARATFGEKTFDRFLYHGIAPDMARFMGGDPDADWKGQLRAEEGGCRDTGH
ncbi:MAG TPA: hypothetical protein VFJ79_00880 [Acidimicrobiales bacterium]|nr:hypothetical protein [Acidimicrobiales bacterium]